MFGEADHTREEVLRARLALTKLLVVGTLPLLLFSHHVYREGHVVDTSLAALGLTLLMASAAGRVWSLLFIGGRKNAELVTRGPYAIVRNPLYFFSFIGFVGAGLAFESLVLAGVLGAVFAAGHVPAIRAEEARLARLFGPEYERYARDVPAFLPSRLPARIDLLPATIRVSPAACLDAALIPLVSVAANLLEWAKLADIVPIVFVLP